MNPAPDQNDGTQILKEVALGAAAVTGLAAFAAQDGAPSQVFNATAVPLGASPRFDNPLLQAQNPIGAPASPTLETALQGVSPVADAFNGLLHTAATPLVAFGVVSFLLGLEKRISSPAKPRPAPGFYPTLELKPPGGRPIG